MKHVAIIGGGIIGTTCAWELARCGADVTVFDANDPADQASIGSLAWLNASSTSDEGYARTRRASMDIWHKIKAENPDCPALFNGALMWGDSAEAVGEFDFSFQLSSAYIIHISKHITTA